MTQYMECRYSEDKAMLSEDNAMSACREYGNKMKAQSLLVMPHKKSMLL